MSTPRTTATKPPASVEIPPELRARIETAIRAAIPDATGVRITLTKRTTGHGARRTPWVLTIVADHPQRGGAYGYGTTDTHITDRWSHGAGLIGNVFETSEKAIKDAESMTARWLASLAKEARARSAEHTRSAEACTREAAEEMAKSERLKAVLAAFQGQSTTTVESTDGQSPQTTTEPV